MLVYIYGLLAAAGLALTWHYNLAYMRDNDGFDVAGFVAGGFANPAAASLSCDILVVALAASLWMVVEARRLGIRHAWVWPGLGWLVAMAFAVPLFFAVREGRLRGLAAPPR
jgi:hypothetical protein